MAAHGVNKRTICPTCKREFERPFDCKQHVKSKRHQPWRDALVPWAKYASGIAARSDETRSGSAEGKSPVPERQTPSYVSDPQSQKA